MEEMLDDIYEKGKSSNFNSKKEIFDVNKTIDSIKYMDKSDMVRTLGLCKKVS